MWEQSLYGKFDSRIPQVFFLLMHSVVLAPIPQSIFRLSQTEIVVPCIMESYHTVSLCCTWVIWGNTYTQYSLSTEYETPSLHNARNCLPAKSIKSHRNIRTSGTMMAATNKHSGSNVNGCGPHLPCSLVFRLLRSAVSSEIIRYHTHASTKEILYIT